MICGCCKDLGCFGPGDIIRFPFVSIGDNSWYRFHIWCNGTYTYIDETFAQNLSIELPFTFNENSETTIKIEFPSDYQNPNCGINFATTTDGACCFTIHGLLTTCH